MTEPATPPGSHSEGGRAAAPAGWPWAAALTLLLAARLAWLAARLRFPDLVADYPFLGGDGLEWIQNGLARAGHPVRAPDRSLLLPLLLATLERLSALSWFPLVNQLVLSAGIAALFAAAWRAHSPRVAFLASLLPAASGAATRASVEVMADTLAAVLLFLAALAFLGGARRPALYPLAGVLGGASALTQPAALLLPLAFALPLLAVRRGELRRPQLLLGGAVFAALALVPAAATAARAWRHGAVGTATRQWTLLDPHLDALPFYAGAAAGLWGVPALLLAAAGLVSLLRGRAAHGWLLLALVLVVGGFFVFFYDFTAQRFLLYLLLPVSLAAAAGLALLKRSGLQLAAGLLAALWAAWPLPGPEHREARFLLWPVPTIVADFGTPRGWSAAAPREAWQAGPWRRIATARSRRPAGPPLPRDPLPGARGVLLLGSADRAASYQPQLLLSSLLRRRVVLAPEALYPAGWWGWERRRFLGEAGGFALFELRVVGAPGPHLVAFEASSPGWRQLLGGTEHGADPPAPCRERAWATARRVAALAAADRAGRGDPYLVVPARTPPGDWERLTPFAAGTSRLVVLLGERATEARRELARWPRETLWRGQEARVVAGRLWAWTALVALPAREPGGCGAAAHSP